MALSEVALSVGGRLAGEDARFLGCSTDSRNLSKGQLFVALEGPHFDGHAYMDAARARGAAGALAEQQMAEHLPTVLVDDARMALGGLAATWRGRFDLPVVAITGSNGKTTVKEMLSAILSCHAAVLATRGNLNNDIGVPLTLMGLAAQHQYAVIEMGANHAGELARLCEIARPMVALVTQCAPAHLEGFGSIDGVAQAKSEVYSGLAKQGVAVINADDDYAGQWRRIAAPRRCVSFGMVADADVTVADAATMTPTGSNFRLRTPSGDCAIKLSLPGKHNIMNALAAAACAEVLKVPLAAIGEGLATVRPVQGRLQTKTGVRGCCLLDDSYNANSASFKAALEVLAGHPHERWVVLGDMGELGADAVAIHRQLGEMAQSAGVARLYAVGELSRHAVDTFGGAAQHFQDTGRLAEALMRELHADVTLLVKGSRTAAMETVVEALMERT